jgi:menaquinone biosynthesis decarboxylase
MYSDLNDFLADLEKRKLLARISDAVSPDLEIAAVTDRVCKTAGGGPALLFDRPAGYDIPVASNVYGSMERMCLALGVKTLDDLAREIDELMTPQMPEGIMDALKMLPMVGRLRDLMPKTVKDAPCQEIVDKNGTLDSLPILKCWPNDGGKYITFPLVFTKDPETGMRNIGTYRMQVYDGRTTGMHWQIGKGGGFHYAAAEARGESLPVTVFLGGPPALMLAAIAPLPENVPEMMLASLIAGRKLARCPGPGPHPLVADAEIALVGHVPPRLRQPEGPFGDHYGYYSLRHDYPVFRVEALCRRKDAIYPATVVGKPRQEDFFIGDLLQELLSPLFPLVMPGVVDLWSYGETGYHSLAAAVVRERYKRESMASAFRILGEGQLSLTKFLLLTDRPVDLRDFRATLEHLLARTRPETDLYVFSNLSMDTLDYTGPTVNEGSKGVWLGVAELEHGARRPAQRDHLGRRGWRCPRLRIAAPGVAAVAGGGLHDAGRRERQRRADGPRRIGRGGRIGQRRRMIRIGRG